MEFIQFILLTLFSFIGTGLCFTLRQNITDPRSQIYGGGPVNIESAPYQIYLEYKGMFGCGGALLTLQHVITAAHCLTPFLKASKKPSIIAGTDNLELILAGEPVDKQYRRNVVNTHIHPLYVEKPPYLYDIAVLKLDKPFVQSTKIKPVALPKRGVNTQDVLIITGIGAHDDTNEISPKLKSYQTRVVPCGAYHTTEFLKYASVVMCHRDVSGSKTGVGDSGTPLVNLQGELAGIHSSSLLQFQTSTRVYALLPFIRECLK